MDILARALAKANSTSISELNADVDFNVTNLVTNGDFSNGTTGWNGITAIVSGRASKLATAQYQTVNQSITAIVGHQYYFKVDVETDVPSAVYFGWLGGGTIKSASGLQTLSQIKTASSTSMSFGVGENRTSNFTTWYIDNILALDLTAIFCNGVVGTGNEPTVAEMDAILAFYPNSWFNGTVNLASNPKMLPYLLNTLRSKADKAQEAYIAPTLQNGATQDETLTVGFYKDAFGIVRWRGKITCPSGGSVVSITAIPGYKPSRTLSLQAMSSANALVPVVISSGGSMWIGATSSAVTVYLDSISYRAEQ